MQRLFRFFCVLFFGLQCHWVIKFGWLHSPNSFGLKTVITTILSNDFAHQQQHFFGRNISNVLQQQQIYIEKCFSLNFFFFKFWNIIWIAVRTQIIDASVDNGMCVGIFNVNHDISVSYTSQVLRTPFGFVVLLYSIDQFFLPLIQRQIIKTIRNLTYGSVLWFIFRKLPMSSSNRRDGNKKSQKEIERERGGERKKCNWWIDCSSCDFCTYIANQVKMVCVHDEEIYRNVKKCWNFCGLFRFCCIFTHFAHVIFLKQEKEKKIDWF